MIRLHNSPYIWKMGTPVPAESNDAAGREKTIAYSILQAHHTGGEGSGLHLRFDSLISHDITYVGIIQTAKASGLERFPVPYVMTNCHNSLCAVGGTINADDHAFGLSAARKYGGIFVPPNLAVIHQYARENMAGCGKMILGSDSHTRYGALGTLGVGEGGPELVKQLLEDTYDIAEPPVVLIYLTGSPMQGVGPQDVAIALCGAVYKNGFVKNCILEFAGPGVANLSMDYRIGIDVMTTETACLSSIWQTDNLTEEYLATHWRGEEYKALSPEDGAEYDKMIEIDLSTVLPMAALPFHPSEAVTIHELQENAGDLLRAVELRAEEQFGGKARLDLVSKLRNGKLYVEQGEIAGCSGGMYENIAEAAAILKGHSVGDGFFSLNVYPPSIPVNMALIQSGVQQQLMAAGAVFKPCFCGPCFGAGDVPANNALSIRHTTRNFPNREGSKPGEGQLSGVILMDARSIAATARNKGRLTAATDVAYIPPAKETAPYDASAYKARVYMGWNDPKPEEPLRFGPNIAEWPPIPAMPENLLIRIASTLRDEVTTTDELIPSGETSSYRSNPLRLAEFALSRRDPEYVSRAKAVQALEKVRATGETVPELTSVLDQAGIDAPLATIGYGSAVFANKPGDGSAREQAASCQRVLGGSANICYEFATKRYRSNCINWGMMPFTLDKDVPFTAQPGDHVYVPNVRQLLLEDAVDYPALLITNEGTSALTLHIAALTEEEKGILLNGCLMNHYAARRKRHD